MGGVKFVLVVFGLILPSLILAHADSNEINFKFAKLFAGASRNCHMNGGGATCGGGGGSGGGGGGSGNEPKCCDPPRDPTLGPDFENDSNWRYIGQATFIDDIDGYPQDPEADEDDAASSRPEPANELEMQRAVVVNPENGRQYLWVGPMREDDVDTDPVFGMPDSFLRPAGDGGDADPFCADFSLFPPRGFAPPSTSEPFYADSFFDITFQLEFDSPVASPPTGAFPFYTTESRSNGDVALKLASAGPDGMDAAGGPVASKAFVVFSAVDDGPIVFEMSPDTTQINIRVNGGNLYSGPIKNLSPEELGIAAELLVGCFNVPGTPTACDASDPNTGRALLLPAVQAAHATTGLLLPAVQKFSVALGGVDLYSICIDDTANYDNAPSQPSSSSKKRSQIGSDGRARVNPTTGYSKRVHGALHRPGNDIHFCSGAKIGPRHFATCGHCVFSKDSKAWVSDIRVRFGQNGNNVLSATANAPYGEKRRVWYYSTWGWVNFRDSNYDYGMIVLQDRASTVGLGWLGYSSSSSFQKSGNSVWIRQHPGHGAFCAASPRTDKRCGGFYYQMSGTIKYKGTWKLKYTIDTNPGSSGSAVYDYNGGNRKVCGVHCYGSARNNCVSSPGGCRNKAIRMKSSVASNYQSWIAQWPSAYA